MKIKKNILFIFLFVFLIVGIFIYKENYNRTDNRNIDLFTKYAIDFKFDYKPYSTFSDYTSIDECTKLPTDINNTLKSVLLAHEIDYIYQRNITLIMLKYFNCQFYYYEQSDEVRENIFLLHPLTQGFFEVLKKNGSHSFEFVTSSDVLSILEKNPQLHLDKYIRDELDKTCKLYKGRDRNLSSEIPYLSCPFSNESIRFGVGKKVE